jgi:hypothetical protein
MRHDAQGSSKSARRGCCRTSTTAEAGFDDDGRERKGGEDMVAREKIEGAWRKVIGEA